MNKKKKVKLNLWYLKKMRLFNMTPINLWYFSIRWRDKQELTFFQLCDQTYNFIFIIINYNILSTIQ